MLLVIGGAALNLLGIVTRYTKDCDILYPQIPKEVRESSRDFAAELRNKGETLQDDCSTMDRLRSVTNFAPIGMNDYKLYLKEVPFTFAASVEATCFGPSCLLFAIGASTWEIALP